MGMVWESPLIKGSSISVLIIFTLAQDVQHGIGVEEWEGGSRYDGQFLWISFDEQCKKSPVLEDYPPEN